MLSIELTKRINDLIQTQDLNNIKDKVILTGLLSLIRDAFFFGNLGNSTKKVLKSIQLYVVDLEAHLCKNIELIRELQEQIKRSDLSNKHTIK
jgi:hypothetical protein